MGFVNVESAFLGAAVNWKETEPGRWEGEFKVPITKIVFHGINPCTVSVPCSIPEIENTVFNGDTTIIIWKDKTKTIVHCEPDKPRDPYAAFCAAVCKKLFGSTDKVMKVIADTDKAYQAKLRAEAAAKKKAENIAKQEELKAKAEARRKEHDEAIREAFYINEKLRREAKRRLAEEEEKGGEA